MTNHLSDFQKRCTVTANMALAAMVLISIILTAAILDVALGDYFDNEFTYHSLAPLAWLIPIYPCFAALNRLRNMLHRFSEGELFGHANSSDIKFIASNAIITMMLKVFVVPGIYAIVSYGWDGRWWIELEPGDSASILLASVLWLFGWLVSEGYKLQSENKSFV